MVIIVSDGATFTYAVREDVVDCDLGGECALLDLKTGEYFTLNRTGAAIWAALQAPQSLEDLITLVSDRFDVSAEVCRGDVESLLRSLDEAGLLVHPQRG